MCAYGNVTSDTGMACSGDSGGPMVVRENERSELLFNSDYSYNCVQEYFDWCYKLWFATIHKWNLISYSVYRCICLLFMHESMMKLWTGSETTQMTWQQWRKATATIYSDWVYYIDYFWLDPLVMVCKNIYLEARIILSILECHFLIQRFFLQNGSVGEIWFIVYVFSCYMVQDRR